jgi:predicted AlkP superfamily phosphohydrolase/phosphomutase
MDPTILIGIDGATFTVLDPLMAAGEMPNLRDLVAGGVRAELLSTPHPLTPPAWTTLMTGRNPGSHGIYDFLKGEVRGGNAFFTLNDHRDVRCETIWSLVSRRGGRIISLNYPMMAPPPPVSGAIVPGLLSWRHLRRNVRPPELYDEIRALPGFDAKGLSWDFEMETAIQNMPEEELGPWVRFHIEREAHWFGILKHAMQSRPWDLAAVMFDGVDKLQHACWRFLDPAFLPENPNAYERTLRDLCLEYFRALDGFIGEIVALGGPSANVFLASDHGFGPSTRIFRVNKWLEQKGYLAWAADDGRQRSNSHFVHLDWGRTIACAQSAATNGIHIRVRGEDGGPGVAPEEYEAFRDRLMAELFAIRDPETGGPLFKDILRKQDAFPGPQTGHAPDLTLVPWDHGFVSVLNAEPIVSIRSTVKGAHYPVGVLMARGPAIARGETLGRQSILDIAPTLLHSLGQPIPSDYEGAVIEEAFDPGYLAANPVRIGDASESSGGDLAAVPAGAAPDDPEGDEMILERLRALGYIE